MEDASHRLDALDASHRLCLYSYMSEYDFGFFTKLTLLTDVHLVIHYNP